MIGPPFRNEVEQRDRGGERLHQIEAQRMPASQSVEQPFLIETVHLDNPLDGHAGPPSASEPSGLRTTATTPR